MVTYKAYPAYITKEKERETTKACSTEMVLNKHSNTSVDFGEDDETVHDELGNDSTTGVEEDNNELLSVDERLLQKDMVELQQPKNNFIDFDEDDETVDHQVGKDKTIAVEVDNHEHVSVDERLLQKNEVKLRPKNEVKLRPAKNNSSGT